MSWMYEKLRIFSVANFCCETRTIHTKFTVSAYQSILIYVWYEILWKLCDNSDGKIKNNNFYFDSLLLKSIHTHNCRKHTEVGRTSLGHFQSFQSFRFSSHLTCVWQCSFWWRFNLQRWRSTLPRFFPRRVSETYFRCMLFFAPHLNWS